MSSETALDREVILLACEDESIFGWSCPSVQLFVAFMLFGCLLLPVFLHSCYVNPLYRRTPCFISSLKRSNVCYDFFCCFCSPVSSERSLLTLESISWEALETPNHGMEFVEDFTRTGESKLKGRRRLIKFMKYKQSLNPTPLESLIQSSNGPQFGHDLEKQNARADILDVPQTPVMITPLNFKEIASLSSKLRNFDMIFRNYGPNYNSPLLTWSTRSKVSDEDDVSSHLFKELNIDPFIDTDNWKKTKRGISFFVWFIFPALALLGLATLMTVALGYDKTNRRFSGFSIIFLLIFAIGLLVLLKFWYTSYTLKSKLEQTRRVNREEHVFVSAVEMGLLGLSYFWGFCCFSSISAALSSVPTRETQMDLRTKTNIDDKFEEEPVAYMATVSNKRDIQQVAPVKSVPVDIFPTKNSLQPVDITAERQSVSPSQSIVISTDKKSRVRILKDPITTEVDLEAEDSASKGDHAGSSKNVLSTIDTEVELEAGADWVGRKRPLKSYISTPAFLKRKTQRQASVNSKESSVAESIASHLAFKKMLSTSKIHGLYKQMSEDGGSEKDLHASVDIFSLSPSHQTRENPPKENAPAEPDNASTTSEPEFEIEFHTSFRYLQEDLENDFGVFAVEALPLDDEFEIGSEDFVVDNVDIQFEGLEDFESVYDWESIDGLPLREEKAEEDLSIASSEEIDQYIREHHLTNLETYSLSPSEESDTNRYYIDDPNKDS